jgi:hypothetical protein
MAAQFIHLTNFEIAKILTHPVGILTKIASFANNLSSQKGPK